MSVRGKGPPPNDAVLQAVHDIGRLARGAKREQRNRVLVILKSAYFASFRTIIRVLIGRDNGRWRLR